ncbi:low molecular weight phosphatase family protein [Paremcibacter congregatus]|uniref:Low molecular weight phosphatase family protein n=1 Tax=Paremcibacter congregatus TaxID=2043170 RepID=A0A2G4YMB3_9PROT|nr:arsenate reductase ArsC [Paremcibacter congregatus]PHZ83464.1 low molecular weight phosphatase family protein [Paremcibacter congregatus]QDE28069.1 arsenate reductase ArsC [Paremcibacter congregatus]|tara:strand:+ start:441 stop:941 length:501 start_codon:yes stop_codon:yes gene_type:complete
MAVIITPITPIISDNDLPLKMPDSVLFMCNFNAVRSPMAEALTKYYFGHRIFTDSVGIRAEEDSANPFSIAVMEEVGLDISDHRPKKFEDLMDSSFDLVVTLSPEAQHKAIDLTRTYDCQVEYWPTLDPTAVTGNRENILAAFRQTRDMITERIKKRFDVDYFPKV